MKLSRYFIGKSVLNTVESLPVGNKDITSFPEGYKFSKEKWGAIYYKIFDKTTYTEAAKQCHTDGGTLPVPKSGMI